MIFNLSLHIIYAYMVTFTLFVCLIKILKNHTTKYRDIHHLPQIGQKKQKTEILIFARIAQP